jgi:hypothetical protein
MTVSKLKIIYKVTSHKLFIMLRKPVMNCLENKSENQKTITEAAWHWGAGNVSAWAQLARRKSVATDSWRWGAGLCCAGAQMRVYIQLFCVF